MSESLRSKKASDLAQRMSAMGIREEDLREKFVLSSGPGGQNVNKVATCVVLVHGPSGIRVKESSYRTQAANRKKAREVLIEKLESRALMKKQAAAAEKFKELARKKKRSFKMKEKMLEGKRIRSQRKQMRKQISGSSAEKFF